MPDADGEATSVEEIADEIRRAMPESASGGFRRPVDSIRALTAAERHLVPGLEAGSKLAFAKSALLRVLRIVTRSQGTYNAAMLEAVRELQSKLTDARREGEETRNLILGIERRLAEIGAAADEIGARQERVDIEFREESARRTEFLREELDRERAVMRAGLLSSAEELRQGVTSDASRLQRELDFVHARLSRMERAGPPADPGASRSPGPRLPDGFYIRFEEQFRGTEGDIRARQDLYADFFLGVPGPVLDCGCGRGEFLEQLRARQIESRGVDTNSIAVELALTKKLDVAIEDFFSTLRRESSSLGGVAALQVVEHLDPAGVYEFLGLALAALAPGGRLLLETINPDSVYALRAYRLDPTHRWPVPAATLELMAREVGFDARRIEMLSPVPESERLVESDENDRRLNRLLFGPQDYALFAEKRR